MTMEKKIVAKILPGLLLVGIFHFIQTGEVAAQSITLQYGHSGGTLLSYGLTVVTPTPQASQEIRLTLTQEVNSVTPEGVMDIDTSFSNGTMIINGVSHPFPIQGEVLNTKMSRRGVVIENTAKGQYQDLLARAGFSSFTSVSGDIFRSLGVLEFPEAPVSVGGTWSVTKTETFPSGESLTITYNYTLEALVSYGGYNCAQIKIEAQPHISFYQDFPTLRRGMHLNGDIKVAGTLLFAYGEGKIIKLSETIETNGVGTAISYEGSATVIPLYQKSTISLEIE